MGGPRFSFVACWRCSTPCRDLSPRLLHACWFWRCFVGVGCDGFKLVIVVIFSGGVLILHSSVAVVIWLGTSCWQARKDLDHVVYWLFWFHGRRCRFPRFVNEVCVRRDCDLVVNRVPDAILVTATVTNHDPFPSTRVELLVLRFG